MYIGLYVKYPLLFSDFNENFLDRFSKSTQIPNVIKNLPVVAELLHADGQTGRRVEVNSRVLRFCERA